MEQEEKTYTTEELKQLARSIAREYNLDEEKFVAVVAHETANTWDPKIQSYIKYKFADPKRGIVIGEREKSFGLAQIHLPDHPNVTKEQATNPEFALRFMAEKWSEGRMAMWSGYTFLYGQKKS
jgi:hypothetical protein